MMMRGLLSHEYSFKKQALPSSPSYIPSLPSCKSPKRVNNPLLPVSPRRGYLNQSQHQYGVKRQEYRNNPHFNNDLDLFSTHSNTHYNRQREQLLQQRQQQSKLTSSKTSSPLRAQSSRPAKQQQLKSPLTGHHAVHTQHQNVQPQCNREMYGKCNNDQTVSGDNMGHLISSTSALNLDCKDIPSYFLDPKAQRISPKADQYRIRQKYDDWGHVQRLHDQLDHDYSQQHRRMDHTKKSTVKQDLLEQMKQNEEKQKRVQQQKRRDYDEMQRKIEEDRIKEQREREQKYSNQRKLKEELDQFGSVQSTISEYQKQKDRELEMQWIQEGRQRAQQERDRQCRERQKEKDRWSQIYRENEEHQKRREEDKEKEKLRDIRSMEMYSQMLAEEEMKRKQHLLKMQKCQDQKDAINFRFLEQKQKKLLEEEQRLLRYQQLREQSLTQQDQHKRSKRNHQEKAHKSFLQKQIEEKQQQKLKEIERTRRERIELEQEIQRQEDDHRRTMENKRRVVSDYAAELEKQQRENYEKQVKGQFYMNESDRLYHRQYLEPQATTNKEIIGSFPRESPSRRDLQRYKYLQ